MKKLEIMPAGARIAENALRWLWAKVQVGNLD
jgi:hypothetical protein